MSVNVYLHVCVPQKRWSDSPETGATDYCEHCVAAGNQTGILFRVQVLLTTQPSLQPPKYL